MKAPEDQQHPPRVPKTMHRCTSLLDRAGCQRELGHEGQCSVDAIDSWLCGLQYEEVLESYRKAARLEAENLRLRGVLGDLVAKLPPCSLCDKPATRAFGRGGPRYCDDHAEYERRVTGEPRLVPEYPRAVPLRAALAALKEKS